MYKKLLIMVAGMGLMLAGCQDQASKYNLDPDNPFFSEFKTPFGVPPFEQIKNSDYVPAFEAGMKIQKDEVDAIVNNSAAPTFKNTIQALDGTGEILNRVSYIFFGQSSANTNDTLQQIQLEISPKLAAHSDEINMNPKLFERVKTIYDQREKLNLTDEESYILENIYKGFVHSGALLSPEDKEKMKAINQKLSVLTVQFGQNVLAETNSVQIVVDDPADMKGLPESSVKAAAKTAEEAGLKGKWVFTAQKPSWIPFLQYDENRALRKKVYDGWLMRGRQDNEHNNEKILAQIVSLRAQKAQLLGYPTHADLVLENRMAKNSKNVMELLDKVWKPALAAAKTDRDIMQAMIRDEGGKFKLAPSDWWYYAEKMRKAKYDLDESQLRPYFKLENVRKGEFDVAHKLYGITFSEIKDIPKPHPEAVAFEVKDADGSHLGVLYQDYYPRAGKRQGAWCGTYRDHHVVHGKEIHPVVTIVCNFTRPGGGKPALLSLDEVSTLFHEFGHALDDLFAKNTLQTTFRPRDFVELPSQFMEHFAVEPEVLKTYAFHYKTGEPIPDELIEKMQKSSVFNQGFASTEYLAACYLDMAYHMLKTTEPVNVPEFEKATLERIGLIPEIEPRYHSTYFTHITGGYDAGYYGYEWSAVLDNDAFEAFKETSLFDQKTARSFRKNILEKNGFADPMAMWMTFRGRKPDITPLMRNRGFIH